MSDTPSLSALPYELLKRLVASLQDVLDGARLQKIRHRDHGDLVFEFYGEAGRCWLRLAAFDEGSRIYRLSSKPEASGKDADAFCMTLRERLVPSLVRGIECLGDDRVVCIRLETPDAKYRLVFEAFGRRANLLLLKEDDRILVGLRGKAGGRDLGPGKSYVPPPPSGARPPDALPEGWDALKGDALHSYFEELWDSGDRARSSVRRQEQAAKVLRKELKRLKRQHKSLQQDIDKAGDPDEHRAIGHLLAASLHTLKRGMSEIELENPGIEGLPERVLVPLDPKKSPEENLNRRYRQAKRAQGTREHGARRLEELQQSMDDLSAQMEAIDAGDEALIERLAPAEVPVKARAKRGPTERTGVARYAFIHEIGGGVIWVGRDATCNDEILRQYARGNDLWFHARDGAGSHVFLRTEGRNPSPEEIRKAAQLAALHSTLKKEAVVDVLWTHCKHVKKPKGAPVGRVQVANGKTIRVSTK